MADYYNANELRASSSAFQWGKLTFTDYKTGCLRKILIQSRAVQSPIQEKYAILGDLNEKRHEERIAASGKRYLREYGFKTPINIKGIDQEITLSGHVDFVYIDENDKPYALDELKSVSSKNSYYRLIKSGTYLTENLAQTVNYMVNVKVTEARLIYTYYEAKKDTEEYQQKDERIYAVHIDDYGRVHIDGEPSRWTVYDQLAHRFAAARAIATETVAERPHLWDAVFASPCAYCPFAEACDKWDQGVIEGAAAFVEYSKSLTI